jgi:hypothetical protein
MDPQNCPELKPEWKGSLPNPNIRPFPYEQHRLLLFLTHVILGILSEVNGLKSVFFVRVGRQLL